MRKIFYILVVVVVLFSCEKENDIFNYSLNYSQPTPANNATSVPFRDGMVIFSSLGRGGLALYVKEYKIYLDTINPPKNIISQSESRLFINGKFSLLKPNTNYYWAYSLEIPSGEIMSEIQQFTTTGFDGIWKLDSIADKNGIKDQEIAFGSISDWTNWYNWNGKSYRFTSTKKIEEYKLNQDSVLQANNVITEISFGYNSAAIKQLKNSKLEILQTFYSYNYQDGSITFKEKFTNETHTYVAVYLGYSESYNKTVLLMLKNNFLLYIYTQKQ